DPPRDPRGAAWSFACTVQFLDQERPGEKLKHFQQKCEAVLRWTMRERKHFQQKCEAVLRRKMRQRIKNFQQKFEAVLRYRGQRARSASANTPDRIGNRPAEVRRSA